MNGVKSAVGERLRRLWTGLTAWFARNFSSTTPGVYYPAVLLAALVTGVSAADVYWPAPLGYFLCTAGLFLLILLGGFLVGQILRRLLGYTFRCPLAAVLLWEAVYELIRRGAKEGSTTRVILVSAVIAAVLWLLGISLWALLIRRRLTPTLAVTGLFSAGCGILIGLFLFTDGLSDPYVARYVALMGDKGKSRVEAFAPSLSAGKYTVEVLDYGTEDGLPSDTVSISAFATRDNGEFTGAYTDYYLEYPLSAVPLVGRVWYPAGEKNCPVLFIAHGNHEIAVDSYLGYDYLGEYLASHGYVVVSVDQNACNLLSGENDARAVLMLEHIGLLLEYGRDPDNPLYGCLDEDNLAIAGHSRGGEMVATAYLFNQYDRYPENGLVRFDYHYNIKSLIAIAPTVNQYKPADHSVHLEDVNYLLLYGTNDRDVTNFMGMTQYENITFTGQGDYLKSALYIAGANHGQFNSLWGAYDQSAPFHTLLNVESLLPEEEQQEITCLFVKTFLDVTLRGDDSCRTLLTDWDSYAGQLPETVYIQCSQTSDFSVLADFEEDSDLETGTAEGVTIETSGLLKWTEELVDFANDTSYDTYALRLRWGSKGTYTLHLPETDASGLTLSFDIADLDDGAVERGEYALLDGQVILTDRNGETASASIGDFATVFPALPVYADKLDLLFREGTYRYGFSTVLMPVSAFAGETFDPTAVVGISFQFSSVGEAGLDNIGWTK